MDENDFDKMAEHIGATATVTTRYDVPEVEEILRSWVLQILQHIIYDWKEPVVLISSFIIRCGGAAIEAVGGSFLDAESAVGLCICENMIEFAEKFASSLVKKWKAESLHYEIESNKLIASFSGVQF